MVRIALVGALGRMGRAVAAVLEHEPDLELSAAIERPGHPELGRPLGKARVTDDLVATLDGADVVVDFALQTGLAGRAAACARAGKPYVCGTTGLDEEAMNGIREAAGKVPVVHAPNFSLGVNALCRLAAEAAKLLGVGYDIEIIETHHRHKRDAPSGTAARLAGILKQATAAESVVYGRSGDVGPRPAKQIGVHAVRAGDVVGEHTVVFGGPGERLELTHRASSREAFARGVLRAIRFAATARPGRYSMDDVLSGQA